MSDQKNILIRNKRSPSTILLGIISLLGPPTGLFLSAGRWDWLNGWIYIGVLLISTLISRVFMIIKNPDLALERARSLNNENVKNWDKWLMPMVSVLGPLTVLIVAGLDERYGWMPLIPLGIVLSGVVILLICIGFSTWVMTENRFFSGTARIQVERGHHVVTTGPYSLVRHPGYLAGIISYLVMPLILGSLWSYIPAGITILLMFVRTALEDQILQEELPGYPAYSQKTRYRLIPGIW